MQAFIYHKDYREEPEKPQLGRFYDASKCVISKQNLENTMIFFKDFLKPQIANIRNL